MARNVEAVSQWLESRHECNPQSAGGKPLLIKIHYPNPNHPSISDADRSLMKKVIEVTDNAKKQVLETPSIVKKGV